jgi:hypothetical protein
MKEGQAGSMENCHFPVLLPLDLQAANHTNQGVVVGVSLHLPLVVVKDLWKEITCSFFRTQKRINLQKGSEG